MHLQLVSMTEVSNMSPGSHLILLCIIYFFNEAIFEIVSGILERVL